MPAIVRTFTTRIESHPVLTARAELESRVERKLGAYEDDGSGARVDIETGQRAQSWLAVSDDPAAKVSSRYWHRSPPAKR